MARPKSASPRLLRACASAAIAIAALAIAPPARATSSQEVTGGNWLDLGNGWFVVAAAGAVGGLEAGFALKDARTDGPLGRGWAISELALNAPLSALVVYGAGRLGAERDGDRSWSLAFTYPLMGALLGLPMGFSTHGAWSLANRSLDSGRLFSTSFAIGVDGFLATHALACAFSGRLHTAPVGVGEAISAAPIGIVAAVYAHRDPEHRTEWGLLAGVSGALVLHGLVSAIFAGHDAVGSVRAGDARVGVQPIVAGERGPAAGITVSGMW
jgi:hypothetical protein